MTELFNLPISLPVWSRWVINILLAFLGSLIIYAIRKYSTASKEFRNIIYTKLEGIYPNTAAYLSIEEKNIRTQNSINPINSAGAKFHHSLPFLCVHFFNKALDNYCETARKTDRDQDVAFEMFRTSMAKAGELSPGEKFRTAIDKLLKFAK